MFQMLCLSCGQVCADPAGASCPHDGGVLDIRYATDSFPLRPDLPGIWRYAARLP